MDIERFSEKVKCAMEDYVGEEKSVRLSEVRKNNGIVLHGMSLLSKDKEMVPTVYMENFHDRYETGESFDVLMAEIITYLERKVSVEDFNVNDFLSFSSAKERIVYRLINSVKNRELLEEIPYIPFLDMAMVFYYIIGEAEVERASILIYNKHLAEWGVRTEELYRVASRNTPRLLPADIISMEDMMISIMKKQMQTRYSEKVAEDSICAAIHREQEQSSCMFILTNRYKFFGAACMAYKDQVADFADSLEDDLYILPSSIHEVIMVPDRVGLDEASLSEMVRSVNRTQVAAEEILSDSVYFYDRSEKIFRIVA